MRDQTQLLERFEYLQRSFFRAHFRGIYQYFWGKRRFVRVIDSGKVGDLASQSASVKTFYVALHQNVHRACYMDFHELTDARSDFITDGAIGRNGGGYGNYAVPGQ